MKKVVLVVLSLIPLILAAMIVHAFPVTKSVTFNKSADSIKAVDKDLFGMAGKS
jgi:hypothetical protein